MHQVDSWRDNKSGPGRFLDGKDGHERLAGAGGQNDDAAAAALRPGGEGLCLMGEGIAAGAQRPRRLVPGTGLVLVGDLVADEVFDEGSIVDTLSSEDAGAR